MSLKVIAVSVVSFGCLAACASSHSGPHAVAVATGPEQPRALRYDTVIDKKPYNLKVTYREMADVACNLPTSTTYFDNNSAKLDVQDETIIQDVVDCVKTGELRGKKILLTGFADWTGEYAYNQDLSMQRAKAVADEMMRLGVAPSQLFLRADGERGASYPGDQSLDRKVVIRVIDAEEI